MVIPHTLTNVFLLFALFDDDDDDDDDDDARTARRARADGVVHDVVARLLIVVVVVVVVDDDVATPTRRAQDAIASARVFERARTARSARCREVRAGARDAQWRPSTSLYPLLSCSRPSHVRTRLVRPHASPTETSDHTVYSHKSCPR